MNQDYPEVKFKVSFIGDSYAGKTSLISRGTDNIFSASQPTIGVDFRIKTYLIDGIKAKVLFWDTVGAQRFRPLTIHLYRNANAICLCFSLENKRSLEDLHFWINDLKNYNGSGKVYLIGCKSDIACQISKAEIQKFAQANCLIYIQTSAKQSIGVEEAFFKIVSEIVADYPGQRTEQWAPLVSKNQKQRWSCC